jgi:hypothetical protein
VSSCGKIEICGNCRDLSDSATLFASQVNHILRNALNALKLFEMMLWV